MREEEAKGAITAFLRALTQTSQEPARALGGRRSVSLDVGLVGGTLRGLAQPKRLLPILVVSASLVLAEFRFERKLAAVSIAVVTGVVFVLVAPLAFRLLFPRRNGHATWF